MRLNKNLLGGLTKLRNLSLKCESLHGIVQSFNIDASLVSDRMKDIVVVDGSLFDAEDEIDPLMQVL
jgi:alkyl hydroperoxide reductase subunit AhpF